MQHQQPIVAGSLEQGHRPVSIAEQPFSIQSLVLFGRPRRIRGRRGRIETGAMAVEPTTVWLEETNNRELHDMQRRFSLGVALSIRLMVIAMCL